MNKFDNGKEYVEIINSDCLNFLKNIKNFTFDLIVVDPPYKLEMPEKSGVDKLMKDKRMKRVNEDWDKFSLDEYLLFSENWIKEGFRVLKQHGSMFIFGSYHNIGLINYICQKNKFMIINEIIWYKRNAVPNLACRRLTASHETILWVSKNKKYKFNYLDLKNGEFETDNLKKPNKQMRDVWDIPTAGNESVGHPTQKPISVYERCIKTAINKQEENSIVLDFFSGSGTCAIACLNIGVNCVLVEKNKDYCSIAENRIIKYLKNEQNKRKQRE